MYGCFASAVRARRFLRLLYPEGRPCQGIRCKQLCRQHIVARPRPRGCPERQRACYFEAAEHRGQLAEAERRERDCRGIGRGRSAVKQGDGDCSLLCQGQVRVLQIGHETDVKCHIPVGHPVITWLVRHAAMVRTMRVVRADGKTGWQLVRGATCKLKLV